MAGFIVIDRKIKEWRFWQNATACALWLHILINANWKDGYYHCAKIPRGSFATSMRHLAEELDTSEKTVRKWLKRFEEEGQISIEASKHYTIIKVLNYSAYQDVGMVRGSQQDSEQYSQQGLFEGLVDGSFEGLDNRTTITTITTEPKKPNSSSRMKRPTVDQIQEYISENNYAVNAEKFYDYYESNGWKVGRNPMKNWKACVRTWSRGSPKKGSNIRIDTPQWHKDGKYDREPEKKVDEDLIREVEELRKQMGETE